MRSQESLSCRECDGEKQSKYSMPEGPEIKRAADRIAKAIVDQPLESIFFAFEQLKPFESTLVEEQVTSVMPRGKAFFEQAHELLKQWKAATEVETRVSIAQFQQITGLDPAPVFGPQMPPPSPVPRTVY